jgi:TolB-like protein
VNKVANAIKEIITSLRNPDPKTSRSEKFYQPVPKKKGKRKILTAIISSLISLLILGYLFYPKLLPSVKKDPARVKSIAVMPFVDMSAAKDQEYFSDGMMEEILNALFKIGGLSIPSRTTLMGYKGTGKSAGEVGRELGVANILEGSIRKTGNIVRITVKLIDPVRDEPVWIENFDRDLADILSVQGEVAQKIATYLKAEISPDVKQRMENQITKNMEALDLYLRAKNIFWTDSEECEKLLQKVIQLDPDCAPAYAVLGGVWLSRGIFDGTLPAKEVVNHATPLLNKALELNYYEPLTHTNLAWLALAYNWDFKTAMNEFNIVNQLNPSDINSIPVNVLLMLGDFKEALSRATSGNSADPSSFLGDIGLSHYFLNENEKALEFCRLELKSNQEDIFTTGKLCIALHLYDDAIKISQEWLNKRKHSRTPVALANLAIGFYHTHNEDKANLLIDELKIQSSHSPVGSPAYFTAMIFAEMQKPDLTFEWLEKAYQNHEMEMIWLKQEPSFRPFHEDPRFQELVEKVGFPK